MGSLFKYADDSNIISPVWKDEDNSEKMVQQFLEWSRRNSMKSNPAKCKELSFHKKCCIETFPLMFGIPQQSSIVILGVTFQEDSRFTIHVHEKLKKANRCLYIIRSLRKEGYRQEEMDHLFITPVLPNITYALSDSVYTVPDSHGHDIKLNSFKTSVALRFMIVLQNLITTNHRRSVKSKYDRKLTELNVVTKRIRYRVNRVSVYGASKPELTKIQCFLERWCKRRYTFQKK